ncbi:MAG TPA: alkaline phosphatase family protein [Verrucomicrobiae bacterium]
MPPTSLDKVKTIVVVMMENRSFDHILGYRSLPPTNADVNGQSEDPAWKKKFTNVDLGGEENQPFLNTNPYSLPPDFDPPHQRTDVTAHLGELKHGVYSMNGFVKAVPTTVSSDPTVRRLVMSYFGATEAPITDFLANNFTICDNWFSSLPSGTQPNRLMAMSGISVIDSNKTPLPFQELVYDWLNANNINWCVYHQGIPFFTLMLKWIPEILWSKHFRPFDQLEADIANTPPDKRPQVIFIEPAYGDSPHLGRCTDDHAPSGISDGQEFLMQVYNAITASPSFWKSSVTVVAYDEHGGFFDHVSPPLIPTNPPPGSNYDSFKSLGVRTPAYIISPFVRQGVAHDLFDHTSILKFIGEKFGPNGLYSPVVDSRPVNSVSVALDFTNPITNPPPAPAMDTYINKVAPPNQTQAQIPSPDTELRKSFRVAIDEMKRQGAGPDHPNFGTLLSQVPANP